jgi:allene oxide cyclase
MVEHATTDAVTDTGTAGDSAGDILTFANEVFDADDKDKIGTDQGICFRTVPGKAWECFWTLTLEKGQLTVEGPFFDSGDSVLAVTGGTGEFAGALGEMALSARGTDGKAYNFTYRIKYGDSARHAVQAPRVRAGSASRSGKACNPRTRTNRGNRR